MSDPSIENTPSADDAAANAFQAAPLLNGRAPPSVPTNAPAIGGRSAKYALFIVFLVVVIDLLGFGIVLPLLPIYGDLYVEHFVASK